MPPRFTAVDYRARTADLDVRGGAVVSGSFQGTDRTYLLDALGRLGPGFVGVAQLPGDVTDDEVLALHAAGVRAVRFTLHRGGALDERLARRAHELAGWHAEVYTGDVAAVERDLRRLPSVCVDHLGLRRECLPALLRLVERGAKVKATGFGRVDLDVPATLRAIADVDPGALLFGTDLPGTRVRRPFARADVELVAGIAPAALYDAPRAFYRPA